MVYAVRTDEPFVTNTPLKTRRTLTEDQKERYEFYDTHSFDIVIDEKTGDYRLDVKSLKS